MKIRPANPIFYIAIIFVPWQFWNTYIDIEDESVIFCRYYANKKGLSKNKVKFLKHDVVKIGFPSEISISSQEPTLVGSNGIYSSQEIIFLLKNGSIISFNARPYTKKQCRKLLAFFPANVEKGACLCKTLKL